MCLGLFTVRKEKTGLLQKLRFPVTVKETFAADAAVLVAEYAFTAEELKKMPNWLRTCLRRYGMRFMKKQKICAAVMTIECAAAFLCPSPGGGETLIRKIRPEEWEECLDAFLSAVQINPKTWNAWIFDRDCRVVTGHFLAKLCTHVQRLCIVTKSPERAEPLCDRLCEEYGIEPEVFIDVRQVPTACTLRIDLDRGVLAYEKSVFANGAEVTMNLAGYRVDLCDLIRKYPAYADALCRKGWVNRPMQSVKDLCGL